MIDPAMSLLSELNLVLTLLQQILDVAIVARYAVDAEKPLV